MGQQCTVVLWPVQHANRAGEPDAAIDQHLTQLTPGLHGRIGHGEPEMGSR
jgi:hypothetical protein